MDEKIRMDMGEIIQGVGGFSSSMTLDTGPYAGGYVHATFAHDMEHATEAERKHLIEQVIAQAHLDDTETVEIPVKLLVEIAAGLTGMLKMTKSHVSALIASVDGTGNHELIAFKKQIRDIIGMNAVVASQYVPMDHRQAYKDRLAQITETQEIEIQ